MTGINVLIYKKQKGQKVSYWKDVLLTTPKLSHTDPR